MVSAGFNHLTTWPAENMVVLSAASSSPLGANSNGRAASWNASVAMSRSSEVSLRSKSRSCGNMFQNDHHII